MHPNEIKHYEYLKSVSIMLEPNSLNEDFQLESNQLISWLTRYDQWFKESINIQNGNQSYKLYNREVGLYGKGFLLIQEKLQKLANTVIDLGYAFSITVDIDELYNNFSLIKSLCEESLLSSLSVVTENIDKLAPHISVSEFIGKIVNLRRPVGIIGPVHSLRKYQVLIPESVNGTDITIYPTGANSISISKAPMYPVKPCANRFRLYIDYDGSIYPCLGLLGLSDFALGHIKNEINDTAITGNSYKMNLNHLIKEGPKLRENKNKIPGMTTLPWICEQHRKELLADG